VQVIKELQEHGADIEAKAHCGRAPLHGACSNGYVAVFNELVSPNDSNDTTTIFGKRKSRGANIEAKTNGGNTPLHFAIVYGHLLVVKALISGGAGILAADAYGQQQPIHKAVNGRHLEVSKYLL
jgi:ankyrin repeat protein